jgi:hypothetical protein
MWWDTHGILFGFDVSGRFVEYSDTGCISKHDYSPVSNVAGWKITNLWLMFPFKAPFIVDFQLPCLITGGC